MFSLKIPLILFVLIYSVESDDDPSVKIAREMYYQLSAQSSVENWNHTESLEKIKSYFDKDVKIYPCDEKQAIDLETFMRFLKFNNKRYMKTESVKSHVGQGGDEVQNIFVLKNKMGFSADESYLYKIENKGWFSNDWKITRLRIDYGCFGFRNVNPQFANLYLKDQGHRNTSIVGFPQEFETIFPFTEYVDQPALLSSMFNENFEAIIDDSNPEISYNLERFMEFMRGFNQFYIYQGPNNTNNLTSKTTIFVRYENHIVFRFDAKFKINERFEEWHFLVQTDYNREGDEKWKISKIFVKPYDVIMYNYDQYHFSLANNMRNVLAEQYISEDVENATQNLKNMFHPDFTADFCGKVGLNIEDFLHILNLERRRTMGIFEISHVEYESQTSFDFEIQVVDKMNFTKMNRYKISIENMNDVWLIRKLEISGDCIGFEKLNKTKLFDDSTPEIVFRFRSIFPFTQYISSNSSQLFYDDFEAITDTNSSIVYDSNLFMDFMKDFNQYYIYQDYYNEITSKPQIKIISKKSDHIVFQFDASFKFLESFETWQFMVEVAYNLDGDKTWKISKIYIRPYDYLLGNFEQYNLNFVKYIKKLFVNKLENYYGATGILKTLLHPDFTADFCENGVINADEFLHVLYLERFRVTGIDENYSPISAYEKEHLFFIKVHVVDKMNFTRFIEYQITIENSNNKVMIKNIRMIGDCKGFEKREEIPRRSPKTYDFVKIFENFFSLGIEDEFDDVFSKDFEAYHDWYLPLTLKKEYFKYYITHLTQLRNYAHSNSKTIIYSKQSDHVVFCTHGIFYYKNEELKIEEELWNFQVEVKLMNNSKWVISRIYIRPPYRTILQKNEDLPIVYFPTIETEILAQISDESVNLRNNIKSLKSHFHHDFSATICGSPKLTSDEFLNVMKFERRRNEPINKKSLPYINNLENHRVQIHIPVENKMHFKSLDIYDIFVEKESLKIQSLDVKGACLGFNKKLELDYINTTLNQKTEESDDFVTIFEELLDDLAYDENIKSNLVHGKFEALIDTNLDDTYNYDEFITYLYHLTHFREIQKRKGYPNSTVIFQNASYLVFQTEVMFKELSRGENTEIWIFQVSVELAPSMQNEKEKQWQISKIYLRPPFELYRKSEKERMIDESKTFMRDVEQIFQDAISNSSYEIDPYFFEKTNLGARLEKLIKTSIPKDVQKVGVRIMGDSQIAGSFLQFRIAAFFKREQRNGIIDRYYLPIDIDAEYNKKNNVYFWKTTTFGPYLIPEK